jgi:hypothetical protein
MPEGPVVNGAVTPAVEVVVDAFRIKDAGEAAGSIETDVVFAGGEDPADIVAVLAEVPIVLEVGEGVDGVVEVAEVVVVAIEEGFDVVSAAEACAGVDSIGVAEGEIDGMVGAEGATGDGDAVSGAAFLEEWEDFVDEVVVILLMAADAAAGVGPFAVEAFGIDAIDAEEGETTGVDSGGEGIGHAAVLEFEEAAHGRRKDEEGNAAKAELEEFHFAVQAGAEPFVIFAVHEGIRFGRDAAIVLV